MLADNFGGQIFDAPLYIRMLGYIIVSAKFPKNTFFGRFCKQIVNKSGEIIILGNSFIKE